MSIKLTKEGKSPKLHLHISKDDYDELQETYRQSACRTFAEFTRNLMLRKPIIIKHRNQTMEDFLAIAVVLKKELGFITTELGKTCKSIQQSGAENGRAAAMEALVADLQRLHQKVDEIKSLMLQIYQSCSQQ